jgi:hypothetical protein
VIGQLYRMPHIAPLARTRTLASLVSEDGGACGAFRPQLEVKKRLTQQAAPGALAKLEKWPPYVPYDYTNSYLDKEVDRR